jgi:hypothetical protein
MSQHPRMGRLISPYGGKLFNLMVNGEERRIDPTGQPPAFHLISPQPVRPGTAGYRRFLLSTGLCQEERPRIR